MSDWKKFQEITKDIPPRKNVVKFLEKYSNIGNAIDLGCGAGNDTVFLIKNKWNVLAIDGTNSESQIRKKLSDFEQEKLIFEVQKFEELNLKNCDLIVANNSLSFCKKKYFYEMWKKIVESINPNGFFVGNLLGINDEWNLKNTEKSFFSKDDVEVLFKNFTIHEFIEIEKERPTASGIMKHWHMFEIIAQKNNRNTI